MIMKEIGRVTEVVVGGHHGEMPYFKVSSGPNGTRRFFINELEVGN